MDDETFKKSRQDCPGALLRERILPALGISVSQAAKDLLVTRQTLHRIMSGQAAITPDMAVRLNKFCGVPSTFWLERQHSYDIKRAIDLNRLLVLRIPSRILPADVLTSIGV